MRVLYKIYIVVIIMLLAVTGAITLFSDTRSYSANENRCLEEYPKASLKSVISGEFQKNMASALNDQFVQRDNLMALSMSIKKVFGYKDIGGVYLADDGYYIARIDEADISKKMYLQNLRYVQYFLSKQKGSNAVILVPSAGNILKDKLPLYSECYDYDSMYKTAETVLSSSKVIDIRRNLQKAGKTEQIYYRTDHHWTLRGAYEAYAEYCKEMGLSIHKYDELDIEQVSKDFYGTLYSKILDDSAIPDKIYALFSDNIKNVKITNNGKLTDSIYDDSKLKKKDKYAYFFGGNFGRVDINTGVKNGRKLLVIKDSFANSFIPFLIDSNSEITMIDNRYYNGSISRLVHSSSYDNTMILYEMSNFAQDTNLYKLTE